jgi:hypothetical protein
MLLDSVSRGPLDRGAIGTPYRHRLTISPTRMASACTAVRRLAPRLDVFRNAHLEGCREPAQRAQLHVSPALCRENRVERALRHGCKVDPRESSLLALLLPEAPKADRIDIVNFHLAPPAARGSLAFRIPLYSHNPASATFPLHHCGDAVE